MLASPTDRPTVAGTPHRCSADADLALMSRRDPPAGAWQGKVVWVVGASQGLGEELARHWAAAGARLVLSSRSLDKLQAVKERCCAHVPDDHVVLLPLDLVGDRCVSRCCSGAAAVFLSHGARRASGCRAERATRPASHRPFPRAARAWRRRRRRRLRPLAAPAWTWWYTTRGPASMQQQRRPRRMWPLPCCG